MKILNFLLKANPISLIISLVKGIGSALSKKSKGYKDDTEAPYHYNRHIKKPTKIDDSDTGSCIMTFNDYDRPCTTSKYETF